MEKIIMTIWNSGFVKGINNVKDSFESVLPAAIRNDEGLISLTYCLLVVGTMLTTFYIYHKIQNSKTEKKESFFSLFF